MNKNKFFFFFISYIFLFTVISKCSQATTISLERKTTVRDMVTLLETTFDTNIDTIIHDGTIKKTSDNSYVMNIQLENNEISLPLKQNNAFIEEMNRRAHSRKNGYCYVKIARDGHTNYARFKNDAIQQAIDSPAPPSVRPQKTISRPEEPKIIPKSAIIPITPAQFELPYPNITADSLELTEADKKRAFAQELARQKEENDTARKGLEEHYQTLYLETIEKSIEQMKDPEKSPKRIPTKWRKEVKKYPMIPKNMQNFTDKEWHEFFYQQHMKERAYWNIRKFNECNDARMRNNLPPLTYQEYSNKVLSKIRKYEQRDEQKEIGPKTKRFNDIQLATEKHFERIKKIEDKTKEYQVHSDNYFKARALGYADSCGKDFVIETAGELILSLIPRKDIEKAITEYEKENAYLEEIIELKQELVSTMKTDDQKEKEACDEHYILAMENQNKLNSYRTKKRKSKKELRNSIQELRKNREHK